MPFWNLKEPFVQDKAIVGSVHFNATKSVTLEAQYIGLNSSGLKVTQAGLFLAEVGGVNRFLPRDVIQTAVTNGVTTGLEVTMPELFLPNDDIYHLEATGLITLASAWAAGDTVTITFIEPSLGINVSYTHTQVGADLAALDDELVAALNTSTNPLYKYARFEVGGAGEVEVYSKGLEFNMVVAATTAGAGTATVTNQLDSTPVLVGTISAVDYANSTLTLAAASAIDLAVGARVGVLASNIYGLYNHSKDWTDIPSCDLKAIERADRIYMQALPYYDAELDARFPNMIFE